MLNPKHSSGFKTACFDIKLLLWKNFKIQFRSPWGSLVEILLPCLLVFVIAMLRTQVDVTKYPEPTFFDKFNIATTDFEDVNPWIIAYVDKSDYARQTMNKLKDQLKKYNSSIVYQLEPFSSMHELENAYANQQDYDKYFLCAVDFVTLSKDMIDFTLRFPSVPRSYKKNPNREDWQTLFIVPQFEVFGPRAKNDDRGGQPGYAREGFLFMQHQISLAAAEAVSGVTRSGKSFEVNAQRFPFPPYVEDFFLVALSFLFPSIMLFSFVYPAVNLSKSIVVEKEKRLYETMKMMGLREVYHYIAYFIKSLVLSIPSIIIMVILLCIKIKNDLAIITFSDYYLIFVFFTLYSISNICFCFLVSSFFSKANLAGIATGFLFFISFFPFNTAIMQYNETSTLTKILSCLLPNTGMGFGVYLMIIKESKGVGLTWANMAEPAVPRDGLTFLLVLVMLMVSSVVCLLITWYVTLAFPGEYGVPLPWYFPFTKQYWCGESHNNLVREDPEMANDDQPKAIDIETDPINLKPGIQLRNLSKSYDGKNYSVKNVNVNMYHEQITALLGHNGAGKSSTISMLIGLYRPTSGTAIINGFDIRKNMPSIRSSLGICPQFNVLFDQLTVAEHLQFYCKLKHTGLSNKEIDLEVKGIIEKLDLVDKTNVLSKNLSGGMQRKLSVGVALVGGSKIVILDEPTSGMDVSARRFIWDLLLQEKHDRTILITTHFMEEADLLGDRIIVMASGKIQCCGSSMFLKKRFGAGYHLTLVKGSQSIETDLLTSVITEYVHTAKLESAVNLEVTYSLPSDQCDRFEPMLARIENDKTLNIINYGISVTTMEEVFLKVGEYATDKIDAMKNGNGNNESDEQTLRSSNSSQNLVSISKNQGLGLLWQQLYGLSVKKLLYSYRSPILLAVQLFLPALLINLGLLVERSVPRIKESPQLHMSMSQFDNPMVIYFENQDSALANIYGQVLQGVVSKDRVRSVHVQDGNESLIWATIASVGLQAYSYEFMISALFEENANNTTITAMFNNQAFHTPSIAFTYLDQALARYAYNLSHVALQVTNHPMPLTLDEKRLLDVKQVQSQFQIIQSLIFAMAFLIGTFAIQTVRERVTKAKHLQMLSGARLGLYWLSHFVFDFMIYFVSCCLIVITLVIWEEHALHDGSQPWLLLFSFFLHGLAIIPFVYCTSFIFALPATAYARLCLIVVIVGMATILTDQITGLKQLSLQSANEVVNPIFGCLVPIFNLGKIITNLGTNYDNSQVCTNDFVSMNQTLNIQKLCPHLDEYPQLKPIAPCCKDHCGDFCLDFEDNPMAIKLPGIGLSLVYMVVSSVIYWTILTLIEFNCIRLLVNQFNTIRYSFQKKYSPASFQNSLLTIDDDVLNEKKAIEHIVPRKNDDYSMVVKNLRKEYGNVVAVDNISYSVRRGDCFGLLGVNGAGKTTSFKMITGDESMTSGDVFINGMSVRRDIRQIQQEIGYCPQFDATFDDLTGGETLTFYSRLRGIREDVIVNQIKELSQLLYFDMHINKLVGNYSGGNKRKLSAAISLLGNPSISFLDEPTTGVDPVARRCLWEAIRTKLKQGCSIVLTSHSMEECEILTSRLIIMVNGQICCLGSPQHLKNKFGQGYTVQIKVSPGEFVLHRRSSSVRHDDAHRSNSFQMARLNSMSSNASNQASQDTLMKNLETVKQFMMETFPGSSLKAVHNNLLHYSIDKIHGEKVRCSQIFGALESNKDRLRIEDYSICQTNLEQIFLTFARNQRITKESAE